MNRELFTALRVLQYALFLVLGLIVLVSTFNVASTLVVLVRERMRDVGVLTAMGLPPASVRRLFVAYGGVLGGAGTLSKSLHAVRAAGQISLIGVLAGGAAEINTLPILMRAIEVRGILVGSRAMFEAMNRALTAHELRPVGVQWRWRPGPDCRSRSLPATGR